MYNYNIYIYMCNTVVIVLAKRKTEITLLHALLTSYPKVVKEKEELQESLVNKDQELSLLRSKLDTTENMLAEARSAAMLPCPSCNDTLSSPHSFQKSLTKEDTFNHNSNPHVS